jgi:hypothetical protein
VFGFVPRLVQQQNSEKGSGSYGKIGKGAEIGAE